MLLIQSTQKTNPKIKRVDHHQICQFIQEVPSTETNMRSSQGVHTNEQSPRNREVGFTMKLSEGVHRKAPEINYGDSTAEEALGELQKLFDVISNPKPNPDLLSTNGVSAKDSHKCEFCGLTLHSLESLKMHLKEHNDSHKNTCSDCHRHFYQSGAT